MLRQTKMPLGTVCIILMLFMAVVFHCIDVSEWINDLGSQCQRLIALAWEMPVFPPTFSSINVTDRLACSSG